MDFATIIGMVLCIGLVLYGIMSGDDGPAALGNFLHGQSALITIGGTFGSVLMANKLKDFVNGLKGFLLAIKESKTNQQEVIKKIIELSNVARKEGLLALEEAAADIDDPFMKKGILLIVDATEPELVRSILETELSCIEQRHKKVTAVWDNLAAMGPAWGMVGTLIGLINMLKHLEDVSSVGPNMSVALITTLYGSLLANWIATPVANKLRTNNSEEIAIKEVMIEGLLSIQAGENPRVIEEKLKSFLAPKERSNDNGDEETAGGGEQA